MSSCQRRTGCCFLQKLGLSSQTHEALTSAVLRSGHRGKGAQGLVRVVRVGVRGQLGCQGWGQGSVETGPS